MFFVSEHAVSSIFSPFGLQVNCLRMITLIIKQLFTNGRIYVIRNFTNITDNEYDWRFYSSARHEIQQLFTGKLDMGLLSLSSIINSTHLLRNAEIDIFTHPSSTKNRKNLSRKNRKGINR